LLSRRFTIGHALRTVSRVYKVSKKGYLARQRRRPDKSAVIEKAAQAIRCLEEDTTIDISSVLEDYGNGLEDPAWMFRFRDEGGLSMVSGTTTSFRSQSIL
jgi:hypothetical protein